MKTRIMFLRNESYFPVGCLAIVVDHNNLVSYNYSVLNPLDKFNRKLAREIATGRLASNPFHVQLEPNRKHSMHEVSYAVMSDLAYNTSRNTATALTHPSSSRHPTRAVKAAKLWLRFMSELTAAMIEDEQYATSETHFFDNKVFDKTDKNSIN